MEEEPLNGFTGFARRAHASFQFSQDSSNSSGQALAFDEQQLDQIEAAQRRWAWVEVDLSAVAHNALEAKRRLRAGCRLMAVVKADGYGHGAVECVRAASSAGADYLGVATVDEGIALRKAGVTLPIQLLAEPPLSAVPLLLAHHIVPSVYSAEFALNYAEMADRHNMKAPFHLAINTGMNRIGIRPEDLIEFERQISFHRALEQVGTFTHFATADSVDTIDFGFQARRFMESIEALRLAGISPGIVHAANSAAIFRYPDVHFDMVRLGISLYGHHPCEQTRGTVDLRPAMAVKARITAVNLVPMSEGVSYGMVYRSPGSVKICTVPLGYADGLNRALSGRCNFILDGQYVHQVGRICMDQCMFEVDMRSFGSRVRLDPQVGDVVTIVGRQGGAVLTITEMAHQLDTIEHELCIDFAHRMERVYV